MSETKHDNPLIATPPRIIHLGIWPTHQFNTFTIVKYIMVHQSDPE